MESKCCICKTAVDGESATILTMSGYGNPRYLCNECDSELAMATGASELSEIGAAMDRISKKMTKNNLDDPTVLKSVKEIMTEASERAEKIKRGEYDFSLDEVQEQACADEIPEELRETEEDKELDRIESEKNKKFDKITNIVCLVVLVAALGFLIYKIISSYL